MGAAGTLAFAWLNYRKARDDSKVAFQLARETRASDNFIKAVEQLGHKAAPVRAGGVIGLGRVLRSTDKDEYWTIIDVVTAFVLSQPGSTNARPAVDVQAALDVLARRGVVDPPLRIDNSPVDIHGFDLTGAWMSGGNFQQGFFQSCKMVKVDLSQARLKMANFVWADLTDANLEGADLTEADLRAARLVHARLQGTILCGADLTEADFEGADLERADLSDADLKGARNLTPEQLAAAKGNARTVLPSSLRKPSIWGS